MLFESQDSIVAVKESRVLGKSFFLLTEKDENAIFSPWIKMKL